MNFLKKIIPDSIAKKVDEYYKNKYIIYDKSRCPSIYHEFKNEHIQKTRLLLTREDLINNLSKNGVIAEIGVDEGVFSERIYNISSPKNFT